MKYSFASTLMLIAGCTFGGSDQDPTDGFEPMISDPTMDGGASDDAATKPDARLDARVPVDAGDAAPRDAGRSDAGPDAARDASALSCTPSPALSVCDPVNNTGCGLFQQCDLDRESSAQSGRCVSWQFSLGGACTSSASSTTCDAKSSCVDGTCRPICYCDDDCAAGSCCRGDAPGASGPAHLCEPC